MMKNKKFLSLQLTFLSLCHPFPLLLLLLACRLRLESRARASFRPGCNNIAQHLPASSFFRLEAVQTDVAERQACTDSPFSPSVRARRGGGGRKPRLFKERNDLLLSRPQCCHIRYPSLPAGEVSPGGSAEQVVPRGTSPPVQKTRLNSC